MSTSESPRKSKKQQKVVEEEESTESTVAKPASKRNPDTANGSVTSSSKKSKGAQELATNHVKNAIAAIKGNVHLNAPTTGLMASSLQDYVVRVISESVHSLEGRGSKKNTITTEDVISASERSPNIFLEPLAADYIKKKLTEEKTEKKKSKSPKAAKTEAKPTDKGPGKKRGASTNGKTETPKKQKNTATQQSSSKPVTTKKNTPSK